MIISEKLLARTLRQRISAPGRARFWRQWPLPNWRASTVPLRPSAIFAARSNLGNLVLEIKSQAESELRNAVGSLKPEEAAVLAFVTRAARQGDGAVESRAHKELDR